MKTNKVFILFVFLFCIPFICCRASIADIADDIIGLKAGEWYEIPHSKLSESGVLPIPIPMGKSTITAVMGAWSGGCFDTKNNRLLVWGGGHRDYAGNEVYAFDLDTFKWSRIWGPTPDQYIYSVDSTAVETYLNGDPSSRHTYNNLQYIPVLNVMYEHGGGKWATTNYLGDWNTWHLSLDTLEWKIMAVKPGLPLRDAVNGGPSAYDPVTGHIFARGMYGMNEYNPANGRWIERYDFGPAWWSFPTADIDPKRRKMFLIGNKRLDVFDLKTYEYQSHKASDLQGDTEILSFDAPGFAFDLTINKFVAWHGSTAKGVAPQDVYVIDPQTLNIEKLKPSDTNTVVPTNGASTGTFGRFRYVPSMNLFILVNSVDDNVFVYKLSK